MQLIRPPSGKVTENAVSAEKSTEKKKREIQIQENWRTLLSKGGDRKGGSNPVVAFKKKFGGPAPGEGRKGPAERGGHEINWGKTEQGGNCYQEAKNLKEQC